MSKGRRSRRPQGHPAKAGRRRERDAGRRASRLPAPDDVARRMMREALNLTDALDAEMWGSSLLGAFWEQRGNLMLEGAGSDDYTIVFGGPLIEAIARAGGVGARIALSVIAAVDDGELGLRAGRLADELAGNEDRTAPSWLAELGEAEITGAAVMRDDIFDDASTMFLEARHRGGEVHAVGVLIDNNFGVMAKDILLADSIEQVEGVVREHPESGGEVRLERIAPGVAAGRIHAALELTDMTWDPPVSEDFAALRALAAMRADEATPYVPAEEHAEVPRAERERLQDEFLSSPEGAGFAPDGDEAYAVRLAIDFCAGYVDGRPLRWSPVVVELFMADWVPRKVVHDAGLLEALPPALDAWVRFAGRKSRLPAWAIGTTREAISHWREEMVERAEDPAAGGPAKEFLTAVQNAGIDVADGDALNTFLAGWNARSDIR